jgi:hypothetical protein
MYYVSGNILERQRLAFYPNPNVERFQDNPDEYEELYFGNTLFTNISEKKVVVFPVRFDFDKDITKFVEFDHSYSHLTLGNYQNCRIPVSGPISPNRFMLFVLRNFYFDKFIECFDNSDFRCDLAFDNLLTKDERTLIHINYL